METSVLIFLIMVGIFIFFAYSRRNSAKTEHAQSARNTEEILPEEIECPGCGADLKLTEKERAERKFACLACKETFVVKNSEMICPSCKSEFGEEIMECPDCKIPLVESLPEETDAEYKMKMWKCKNCGELLEGHFDACWKCMTSRIGAPEELDGNESLVAISESTKESLTGGAMKIYNIYKNLSGQVEAVKQGWSWPGFFFTWIWCFVKGLHGLGAGLLIAWLIGRIVSVENEAMSALTSLASLGISIWLGVSGNEMREKKLKQNGYELLCTTEDAVAEFLKKQYVGAIRI